MLQIMFTGIFCGITLMWIPQKTSDLGIGLVSSGNKLLHKLLLTQIYVAIWRH